MMTRAASVIAVAFVFIVNGTSFAQEKEIAKKDVPKPVMTAFTTAYPKALIKGTSREKEKGQTFYEFECVDAGVKRDVIYRPDGSLYQVEEVIKTSKLPDAVSNSFKKQYHGYKINVAEKTMKGSSTDYELHATSPKGKRVEVLFDEQGNLIKD
jgi:hypothetical protein